MKLATTAAAVVLASYAGLAGWYVLQSAYLDQIEATATAIAAVVAAGAPMYPALDAAERYAHPYGPAFFFIQSWALTLFGGSIATSKAVAAVGAIAALGVTLWSLARPFGRSRALVGTGAAALACLSFGHVSFWPRPEPYLLLCTSLGLAGATARRPAVAAICVGAALGIAVNLKIIGAAYVLPSFVILLSRHAAAATWGVVIAAIIAVIPFAASSVSASAYVDTLQLTAGHGVSPRELVRNVVRAVLLLAPLSLCWWGTRYEDGRSRVTIAFVSLAAMMLIICVTAAKPGSGPYHLMPFTPLIVYATIAAWPWETRAIDRAVAWGVVAVLLALTIPRLSVFVRAVAARDLGPAVADVRTFAATHPGARFGVGFAGTSYLSQARVEAAVLTGEYLVDTSTIQDSRLAGAELPPATLEAMHSCRMTYWLMPKDGEPFAVPSAYGSRGPATVFSDVFVAAFASQYQRVGETPAFYIWKCRI